MPQKKQPAEACHRPAGIEYFADGCAAVALIPHQVGKGHDTIELRENPQPNSKKHWVVRVNNFPSFPISTQQLASVWQFRRAAFRQMLNNGRDFERWPFGIFGLPQASWHQIVAGLAAALERGGE
jgi:hypothetical protein